MDISQLLSSYDFSPYFLQTYAISCAKAAIDINRNNIKANDIILLEKALMVAEAYINGDKAVTEAMVKAEGDKAYAIGYAYGYSATHATSTAAATAAAATATYATTYASTTATAYAATTYASDAGVDCKKILIDKINEMKELDRLLIGFA